jgi:hypothetical protein
MGNVGDFGCSQAAVTKALKGTTASFRRPAPNWRCRPEAVIRHPKLPSGLQSFAKRVVGHIPVPDSHCRCLTDRAVNGPCEGVRRLVCWEASDRRTHLRAALSDSYLGVGGRSRRRMGRSVLAIPARSRPTPRERGRLRIQVLLLGRSQAIRDEVRPRRASSS